MKKIHCFVKKGIFISFSVLSAVIALSSQAAPVSANNSPATLTPVSSIVTTTPLATPQPKPVTLSPPAINAKGYVLMDAKTGEILAQQNMDQRMAPASLTKIMTIYVIAEALQKGQIHLDDQVTISKEAWQTGGSRMFIRVGTQVPVQQLIDGIVIVSGNDAAVAMAEYVGGTQQSFVDLMNQTAAKLGMTNTHFADVNGLPAADHYTTPRDLAVLTRSLIKNFPDYYGQWFHQKWFTYNNIRQPNRNRLLWRDPSVDGLKTGFTDDAGYCLIASALRNDMRLISVVMGTPSDRERANSTQALLNWGFRAFESHKLYAAGQTLVEPRAWMGENKFTPLGTAKDIFIVIPAGQYQNLKASLTLNKNLQAPLNKGQAYGTIDITLNGKPLFSTPLVALEENPRGGLLNRIRDHLIHFFSQWFNKDK